MTGRRELLAVAGGCAAAGVVALVAAGRTWSTSTVDRPHPLADVIERHPGTDVAPAVSALALVALAGAVALLATRGWARVATGAVLVLVGSLLVVESVTWDVPGGGDRGAWAVVAIATGAVVAGCGAVAVVRGRRWASMSRRYDAPAVAAGAAAQTEDATPAAARSAAAPAGAGDPDLWAALERGEDPTAGS